MSPAATLAMLAGVHLAAVMSPGPNTVLVIQTAAHDRRSGLLTALGFWPAGAFWSAVGLAGLGSLLALAPWLNPMLHVGCGAYLLYLGGKLIVASFRARAEAAGPGRLSWLRAMAAGFVTNMTNPKSIAYYLSVFAATGAIVLPLGYQMAAICLLPSVGVLFYGSLALLISTASVQRLYKRAARWLDRVAGGVMMFFGAKLLSTA